LLNFLNHRSRKSKKQNVCFQIKQADKSNEISDKLTTSRAGETIKAKPHLSRMDGDKYGTEPHHCDPSKPN